MAMGMHHTSSIITDSFTKFNEIFRSFVMCATKPDIAILVSYDKLEIIKRPHAEGHFMVAYMLIVVHDDSELEKPTCSAFI